MQGTNTSVKKAALPSTGRILRCKFLDRVHPAEGRAQLEGFFESVASVNAASSANEIARSGVSKQRKKDKVALNLERNFMIAVLNAVLST